MLLGFRRARFAFVGLMTLFSAFCYAEDTYKLEEPVDDARIYGVGTRVDIKGKLQTAPNATHLAQTVSAALSYRERRMLGPGNDAEGFRSIRDYETAEAQIDVDGSKSSIRLPDTSKLMVAQGRFDGVELHSLNNLLTADELDLVRSPADSLALISLLPTKEVGLGDKWTIPTWAVQLLTGLDAVTKGELTCSLDSVDKGLAKVKMTGAVEGAVSGSTTEVNINGFYTYNLEKKYIADTDFVQKETRAVGPISPGLDIVARVRVLRSPSAASGRLGDQKVIDLAATDSDPAAKQLRFESPWNIGLQHGRHWHLYKVDDKLAVFRLLDQGNFVAQCDFAPIPPVKPGTHLSEQVYLDDIRHSLGERLVSMNQGEVVPANDKRFVFKVIAHGNVGERKVTWIFYLVADPSGRQVSMMFTVDTSLAETLIKYDRELVDSMKFGPAPVPRSAKN